jgi:hypothetical protein
VAADERKGKRSGQGMMKTEEMLLQWRIFKCRDTEMSSFLSSFVTDPFSLFSKPNDSKDGHKSLLPLLLMAGQA